MLPVDAKKCKICGSRKTKHESGICSVCRRRKKARPCMIVNIVLLIAGCFLDSTSALYIFTPLFAPVALQLGIDPIHLGTVMIVNLAIGLFTPPVGVNLYVACGIGDIKIEQITKGIVPCLIAELIVLLLVTYIPGLSTMLVG